MSPNTKQSMMKDPAFTHDGQIKRFQLKNVATEKCSVCHCKGKSQLPMRMCEYCHCTICTPCWDLNGKSWHHARETDFGDDGAANNAVVDQREMPAESSGAAGKQASAGLPDASSKHQETDKSHISSATQNVGVAPGTSQSPTELSAPQITMGPDQSKELSAKAKGKQRAGTPLEESRPSSRASTSSLSTIGSDFEYDDDLEPALPRKRRNSKTIVAQPLDPEFDYDEGLDAPPLHDSTNTRSIVAEEDHLSDDEAIGVAIANSLKDKRLWDRAGESSTMASRKASAAETSHTLGRSSISSRLRPRLAPSGVHAANKQDRRVSFALPTDRSSSSTSSSTSSPKRKSTIPPSSKRAPKRHKTGKPEQRAPPPPPLSERQIADDQLFMRTAGHSAQLSRLNDALALEMTADRHVRGTPQLHWSERNPANRVCPESFVRNDELGLVERLLDEIRWRVGRMRQQQRTQTASSAQSTPTVTGEPHVESTPSDQLSSQPTAERQARGTPPAPALTWEEHDRWTELGVFEMLRILQERSARPQDRAAQGASSAQSVPQTSGGQQGGHASSTPATSPSTQEQQGRATSLSRATRPSTEDEQSGDSSSARATPPSTGDELAGEPTPPSSGEHQNVPRSSRGAAEAPSQKQHAEHLSTVQTAAPARPEQGQHRAQCSSQAENVSSTGEQEQEHQVRSPSGSASARHITPPGSATQLASSSPSNLETQRDAPRPSQPQNPSQRPQSSGGSSSHLNLASEVVEEQMSQLAGARNMLADALATAAEDPAGLRDTLLRLDTLAVSLKRTAGESWDMVRDLIYAARRENTVLSEGNTNDSNGNGSENQREPSIGSGVSDWHDDVSGEGFMDDEEETEDLKEETTSEK